MAKGLPDLYHGVGVQFAVFQQIMACLFLLLRRHVLDFREDTHGLTAVMNPLQIVVIQRRVIREDGRQNALDGKRAAHGAIVIMTGLERHQQIHDVIPDIQQVFGKVRELFRQFRKALGMQEAVANLACAGEEAARAYDLGRI